MIRFAVMVAFLDYTRRGKFISRAVLTLMLLCIGIIMHLDMLPGALAVSNNAGSAARPLSGNGNTNPRLPRTSASQLNSGNSATTSFKLATKSLNTTRNGNLRTREQQLLNIFEIIITTLEGKLKRIDNLDKTVELMMNHMDNLDSRVSDNIGKSELIISKLHRLEAHLVQDVPAIQVARSDKDKQKTKPLSSSSNILENQLVQLDEKVTNIDIKLEVLKSQIDNNFLQGEDFNAEASEKKPIAMNVIDVTKPLNPEAMTHVSEELSGLRDSTDSIDKKLQFHINIVSENIGRMIRMIHDIHYAVVNHHEQVNAFNITTTASPPIKSSKIDALVKQIRPMVSVSEKMEEVWDVVVGTKSTVDHLLPKSDAILTQTQRQERAIDEIHQDLKTKTNLIINNLDMVEKRLKKQENDVQILATRPGPTELEVDSTIDRLVEYDPSKYSIIDDNFTEVNTPLPPILPSLPLSTTTSTSTSQSPTASSTGDVITSDVPILSMSANISMQSGTLSSSTSSNSPIPTKSTIRKGGIIFPSVKNKPAVINNTFTNDILSLKDIRIIDVAKSQVWGPGLKPADIVLPARYFFIHAIDNSGKKMSMTHKNYEVSIDGYSKDGKCRSNINYIDREDGSVIVRYTLVDWCEQMKIIVKHNSLHVAQSPYYIQKKVYSERCYCPQDLDLWLLSNGCSEFSKDSQISWDLHLFKRVNFSAIRENILKRYNAPESISLCHYVVKKQHIWRKCFGKYTGFKMFMDATLSSLARVVVLPEMEFYLNLGDWPLSRKGGQQRASGPYPIFSWCGSDDSYDITLPTYDITESTLENMGRVMLDMLSVQQTDIPWDNKEEKGFFRGRDSRRERLNLIELARKFPDMINASITNFFFFRNEEQKYGPRVPHISFMEFFRGFSCVDLLNAGMKSSGVFYLQIRGTTYWFLKVYCEQEISDGGWTVIQRRDDFGEPRENFNRDWSDYKNGFGEPSKEFWLGNENIYMLTNNEEYTLRVELEDFEGNKRYAQYSHFKIHSEADYYKLEIDGYEGNAGDSLNDPWYGSNNSPFSTYNKDNDRSSLNCASMLKGGWWWKSCGRGLNGLYLHDPQDLTARQGIVWFRWRGWDYTLKKATMMIRPRAPQPQSMMVTSV